MVARGDGRSARWLVRSTACGGCLHSLGTYGLDFFLWLTGEEARVTGAQLSWRALGQHVEDYATVLLRSTSGILGTIEVGNTFPGDGTDGEWKIAARETILVFKDNVLRVITARGIETLPVEPRDNLSFLILRQTLEHWQRGESLPVSIHRVEATREPLAPYAGR